MNKPRRSLIGKVVRFRWRDSFQGEFEENLADLDTDVIWNAVGLVVRQTDLFLTITYGTQEGKDYNLHSPLSVPWTQILTLKVIAEAAA